MQGGRTLGHRDAGSSPHPAPGAGALAGHALEAHEQLLGVLRGIGSVMFLTTRRIIVARDGMERRPRSGVQSFPLEVIDRVWIEFGTGHSGRIVVLTAGDLEAISMFFEPKARERAEEFAAAANARLPGARRRAKRISRLFGGRF